MPQKYKVTVSICRVVTLYSCLLDPLLNFSAFSISRPPNLLAPDPQLLKDGKVMVPSQQRDTDKVQLRTDNEIASSTSALDTLDTPAEQPPML